MFLLKTRAALLPARSARALRVMPALWKEVVILTPEFAESVSKGRLSKFSFAVGEYVNRDDIVAIIETDKSASEVRTPESGQLIKFIVEEGTDVERKQPLAVVETDAVPPAQAASTPVATPVVAPTPVAEAPKAAPAPPKPTPAAPKPSVAATPSAQKSSKGSDDGVRRVRMSVMRSRIAERLKQAQNTAAMLTTFNEIDMSNIIEFREKYKESFQQKYGVKLGFMGAFCKASAYALKDQPSVNAYLDGEDIVYHDYVNISVAVATPKGLVVPVVRGVDTMSIAQIEKTINDYGVKARDGKLPIEDMDGGTFTISNGGVFGSLMGTPILNPPQSAILGMHKTEDRPVVVKGQIVIRPMMYVALTYDHRIIDGREAVTCLKKIKEAIEDPRILLLD